MRPAPPNPKAFTILVVEDEFLIGLELVDVLEGAGYAVLGPAPTVNAALTLMEQTAFDACILDVSLREGDSGPVAEALKAKGVPFVLSSAYERATLDKVPAFRDVPNIGKPNPPHEVLAALAAMTEDRGVGGH
ncbi:response regulator [Pelagibacterium montanilacus]|uniref:response regulator n=1 Tax=Pelagibacterium montanilacus TaxID=2185280 RepID=UPI0019CF815E|nr:response regulator [Pelagibacterium montanilacus]